MKDLSVALQGDVIIEQLILTGARLSSVGAGYLAAVLPEMFGLRYLDLTSNLICDDGATAIAEALPSCGGYLKLLP